MSQGKLLKKRYQKFRRMGEESGHSQEAMSREVDLLMSITLGDAPPGRPSRKQRRRGRKDVAAEAEVASDD
jgi:hypothetical protein